MDKLKSRWKQLPAKLRQAIIFLIGGLLIAAAVPIGVVPGPGGTIIFLLGIAVLSTEFRWAERFRDAILNLLGWFGNYLRTHRFVAALFWGGITAWLGFAIWYVFLR